MFQKKTKKPFTIDFELGRMYRDEILKENTRKAVHNDQIQGTMTRLDGSYQAYIHWNRISSD